MNLNILLTLAAALDASIEELKNGTFEDTSMLEEYEDALKVVELQIAVMTGQMKITLKAA